MKYRAEIDGLRALAVVPVILFHAGLEMFSGGFVGVDVFFVISGYLITTILIEDIENNRFSIVNFYERRARRILPALFFIVSITLIFSLIYLPPHALKDIGQSIFSVSLFISNIFFYKEVDYFANTSELAPLLHTWSLGVEEQFYFIFPFLLLALKAVSRVGKSSVIFLLLVVSLLVSEWLVHVNSQLSFFMPYTRFWELAVGSLIALNVNKLNQIKSLLLINILSIFGVVLIFIPMISYSATTIFPGFNALLPVVGTGLIIIFAKQNALVARVLAFRLFVNIGLLSYSLYLSHNVVFALSRNIGIPLSDWSVQMTLIIISVIISLISYFFIEKPLRFLKIKRNTYLIISSIFILIFAFIGYALHKTDGLKNWKLSNLPSQLSAQVIDANEEISNRDLITSKLLPSAGDPFDVNRTTDNVLILGDSKSEDLYISIARIYSGNKYQFRRLYVDDTEMVGDPLNKPNSSNMEKVISSKTFAEADEVILTATWQSRSNQGVAEFVKFLINEGKKVSIISTSNFNDVASLSYVIATRGIKESDLNSYLFEQIREDWRRQYLELKQTIEDQSLDVRFLEKLNAFCDIDLKQCSLKDVNGWYIYDSGHLTVNGYKYFGKYVLDNWFPE